MVVNRFSIADVDALDLAEANDIPNLMVIAGPNGVGKSTLLEDLREKLQNPTINHIEVDGMARPVYVSPHRAPAEIELDDATITRTNSDGFIESMGSNRYRAGTSPDLPNLLRSVRDRSRFQADYAPYYEVQRELVDFYRDRSDITTSIVDREGEVNKKDLPNIYDPIEDAVDRLLPGIQFEEIERKDGEYRILFRNRTGDVVKYGKLSSGERDLLAIVFCFLGPILSNRIAEARNESIDDRNIVVLLDGPESYMHPQLQLKFLNYLEDYIEGGREYGIETQIIMVSHSTAIIDNVARESLYYLFYPDQIDGENQLKPASKLPSELEEIISEEIGLSVLTSGEDLLLVEGDTDREVFNRIDEDLDRSTTIVPIGGKEPIIGLDGAFNELVPELRESNIELYAIVDRDRDLSLSDRVNNNIHTLPVTMVENLVIKPSALFSTLDDVLGEELYQTKWNTPDDIEQLLEQIVNEDEFIQEEAQLRWNEQFNPVNVDYEGYQKSEGFSDIEDFAKNTVENRLSGVDDYSTIEQNMAESAKNKEYEKLNGKKILSEVSNKFNIKTERLLRMTARKIDSDDLPEETREFLTTIKTSSS